MKKHYYYPAIVHKDVEGGFWAEFPGLSGCLTEGQEIEELLDMAIEAIGLYLEDEIASDTMPEPMAFEEITIEKDEYSTYDFVMLIDFQPEEYLRRVSDQPVKIAITLPNWLNELANRKGLNFSQILQEGLKLHLGLLDTADITD